MAIGDKLKGVGAGLLILFGIVVLTLIGYAFVVGATAASFYVIKWSPWVFWPTLVACIFLLGPLAIIPPTRLASAIGFMIASFIFGAITWFFALAFTYVVWGFVGVIVGLVVAGIGIVPVAMLAALLHAEWPTLVGFVLLVILTFGLRALAQWLAEKVDERAARLALEKTANVPSMVE